MKDKDALQTDLAAQRRAGFSRRDFLRGAGVCLALPALESLLPRQALAANAGGLATTGSGAPLRTAFVYFPNGAIQPNWWPTGTGAAKNSGVAAAVGPLGTALATLVRTSSARPGLRL